MEGGGLFKRIKRPGFLQTRENRSLPPPYENPFDEGYSDLDDKYEITDPKVIEARDSQTEFEIASRYHGERSHSVPEARQIHQMVALPRPSMPHASSSSKKKLKDPMGLIPISTPRNPVMDIIFLHGLGGSSCKSWSWDHDQRNFWLPWLSAEPGLSNARIWTFGYAADIGGASNTMNILDFTRDLLFKMKYEQQELPIGSLPINFVTHSMGGLIAKKAYVTGQNDKDYMDMISQVRSIIFLSTPHRGGNGAEPLSLLLQAFNLSKDYIKELASNSAFLQNINDDFTNVCEDLKLFSFYETLKTSSPAGSKYIVDKRSGILNLQNETSIPMVADHHSICKFENPDCPRYRDIRNILSSLVPLAIEDNSVTSTVDSSSEIRELADALSIVESELSETSERSKVKLKHGTCSWIENRKWFTQWLHNDEEEPNLLWISGAPASGKSVLASYIVEIIQKQWGEAYCQYHSFDFSDRPKRSASYLFRTIAYQMARFSPSLRAKLVQMSDQLGTSFADMSSVTLWEKAFCDGLLGMTLGKTMYWVIDGLDEAEPGALQSVFQCLRAIGSGTRLKILFLSRPTADVTMRIKQLPFRCTTHNLSTVDTYDDIRSFVEEAVGTMIPRGVASRQRIVDKVLTKASGNFLWVALATKDLEGSWHLRSEIDHTLNSFPSEMTPLYSRMLAKIENQQATREMATTFLIWATYSFRPLHIPELKVALQPEFPDLTSPEHTISHICGDFVQMQNSRMNLIHETARYFLVNNNASTIVSLKSGVSHEYLATVCLKYLSSNKERQWRQILNIAEIRQAQGTAVDNAATSLHETEPFLRYAATFWPYHLSLARTDSQQFRTLVCEFFDNDVLTWINTLAILGDLKSLIKAARYLKTFIKARERALPDDVPRTYQADDTEFLKLWTVDLIKIVGKFGSNLLQQASSIYKLIPPFCPTNSNIKKLLRHGHGGLSVVGVSFPDWDDCHAHLSVGTDESASKLFATSDVFAALVPQAQCLVVWHAETCEELRRMNHGEYVTEVAVNKKGNLVCTSGLHSIKIWELATGKELGVIKKHSDDRVLAVSFGTSDDQILIGYQDQLIACQNWRTGKLIQAFRAILKGDEDGNQGLRCVSFNPQGTQVAVGSRARPLELWDLSTMSRTHRCIKKDEISHSEKDVFLQPEVIQWHPDSGNLYILYQNTTLVNWNPVYDEQTEHHLGAKGMVISPCGNYLLTSDNTGSVRVFTVPEHSRTRATDFCSIYYLKNHDYVSDLAFSPDGQRFYDLRGSICSVWEPEALVPAEKPDAEEDRTSSTGSFWDVETVKSSATSHNRTSITAIACAPRDLGFCCGRDDGSVAIHEMTTSKRIRTLPGHASEMAIIGLAWSSSGSFIASGDDSGHVLVRKIATPASAGGKMTIYKASDFRIKNDGINQLLFSSDDKFLLVSTFSADTIWDVSAKRICHIRTHSSPRHIKWIEHPKDSSQLISINEGEIRIFHWVDFADLTIDGPLQISNRKRKSPIERTFDELVLLQNLATAETQIVNCIASTKNSKSIIFETTPSFGHGRDVNKRRRIELIRTSDLKIPSTLSLDHVNPVLDREIPLENSIQDLAREVSKLVGSYQNQVVFFDHHHWLCTWEIGTSSGSNKRHFFLPKDWTSTETLSLVVLSEFGTILCPRNGEVAIIKDGIKF